MVETSGDRPARQPPARSARAAVLGSALLAALFVAGTFLVPAVAQRGGGGAGLFRWVYAPLCHQDPGRSLPVGSSHQTVCARCSGLYLGGVTGLLVAACIPLGARRRPRPAWLGLAAIPTLIDVSLHTLGLPALPNLPRLVAALPVGLLAGLFLADGIYDLFVHGVARSPRARRSTPRPLALEEVDG